MTQVSDESGQVFGFPPGCGGVRGNILAFWNYRQELIMRLCRIMAAEVSTIEVERRISTAAEMHRKTSFISAFVCEPDGHVLEVCLQVSEVPGSLWFGLVPQFVVSAAARFAMERKWCLAWMARSCIVLYVRHLWCLF